MLTQPGHKTFLDCKYPIKMYMATHLHSWCGFSNNTLGIGLQDKDIIFVWGFTKTTTWVVAAFSDNSRGEELVIPGSCFVPSGSDGLRVFISHEGPVSIESREGPHDRISTWKDSRVPKYKYDQCIFLNYYKMKRRTVADAPRVGLRVADPDTLPDEDEDEDFH